MHTLWKGALSFGLVHIPVRMYSASSEKGLSFKMLHKKDLSEIRYARICKADGKEVAWKDIVKGSETAKGNYVVLTEEDFKKANLEKTSTIEILDFTEQDEIDVIYYDTPYFLEPEKGAGSAYNLLATALKTSKKVAIGRFVFHHHEHIGVIRPFQNVLVLQQLRYSQEIANLKQIIVPKAAVPKTELALALRLIEELTGPFKLEKYSDTYEDELKDIIQKKGKGKKITGKTPKGKGLAKVYDITSLLKESLEKRRKSA